MQHGFAVPQATYPMLASWLANTPERRRRLVMQYADELKIERDRYAREHGHELPLSIGTT